MENKPVGAVYVTTCSVNGKEYIGKFLYNRINDWEKYLGSGRYLKEDIKKYGKDKFTKTIINSVKKANSRAIEIEGIKYESTSEASRILSIGYTTIGYRLDSDNYPEYRRLTPRKFEKKWLQFILNA